MKQQIQSAADAAPDPYQQAIAARLYLAIELIDAGDVAGANGGVGATVNKLIEASGVPVVKINWGKPCFKKEYLARFYNRRACAMVRFRDAVKSGRVLLPQGIDKRLKEKILLQGARLPYHFAEAGGLRYVMEKKEIMRKNGIKSPDIIDAMSFVFEESGTEYMVSDEAGSRSNNTVESAKAKADELFADLELEIA